MRCSAEVGGTSDAKLFGSVCGGYLALDTSHPDPKLMTGLVAVAGEQTRSSQLNGRVTVFRESMQRLGEYSHRQ